MRAVLPLEPSFLTLHAAGGAAMIAAARKAAEAAGAARPLLLAVTVLTSLNAADLAATGIAGGPTQQVLRLARMALDAGKDRFWLKQLWSMSSDYPAKLLMQAAGKVDHEWCQTAVIRCQRLDRRMKSEKNMDSEAELKLFLMELAGSR